MIEKNLLFRYLINVTFTPTKDYNLRQNRKQKQKKLQMGKMEELRYKYESLRIFYVVALFYDVDVLAREQQTNTIRT